MSEETTTTVAGTETAEVDPAAEAQEQTSRPTPRDIVRRTAATQAAPGAEPESADPWADFEWDGKVESLPAPLQKIVRDARAGEAKARTNAKEAAAAEAREQARREMTQEFGKMLGLVKEDEPADPDALREQIEEHRTVAWRNGVENRVTRLAPKLGADADALLDSMSFITTLDDLMDSDPRSAEFVAALEGKIREAVEKDPAKFKLAGQAPASTPAPASRRPVESLRPGAAPSSSGAADDLNAWFRDFAKGGR